MSKRVCFSVALICLLVSTAKAQWEIGPGPCYDYTYSKSCADVSVNPWPPGVTAIPCSGCEFRAEGNPDGTSDAWWECTQPLARSKTGNWNYAGIPQITSVDSGGRELLSQSGLPAVDPWMDEHLVVCTNFTECMSDCHVPGREADDESPPPPFCKTWTSGEWGIYWYGLTNYACDYNDPGSGSSGGGGDDDDGGDGDDGGDDEGYGDGHDG